MKFKQIEKSINGLRNILANAVLDAKETERERLKKMFIAQQPRLEDKVENIVMLDQVINQYVDLKYDLRPLLIAMKEANNMAEYRRTYSLILKMEDCIGRTLGRMGLSLAPQKYIPTEERKSFDPKAVRASQAKANGLVEQIKSEEPEVPTIPMPQLKKKKDDKIGN